MAEYKHGVYGESQASNYASEVSLGTLPVYIGSFPVQRIDAKKRANYINKPILISSYREINELGIYSDDWKSYTLCEPMYAHFMNGDDVISPIVLINILDPSTHVATQTKTEEVTVNKEGNSYVGYINDPLCIIDELAITVSSVSFTDGDVTYAYEGDKIKIAITKKEFNSATVTATYKAIEFAVDKITPVNFKTAIDAVDNVESMTGLIPTILCAPAFSEKPELHSMMIQKAIDRVAMKWHIICVSDIPTTVDVQTIEAAKTWKATNQYNSKFDKVCWPAISKGNKLFHLSTIVTFTMQLTDFNHDNTPYVSPSNKIIGADKITLSDGTVMFLKEYEANTLNEVGITTVNLVKQSLRVWGSHMSNFNNAKINDIKPEDMFDAQIRMRNHILNYLQVNYIDNIDESFSTKDFDSVLNSVQTYLDSLVNDGKLLYAKARFDTQINTITSLEKGDIVFDIDITYTINAKSITFRLQYTRNGILNLLEGGAE